jgi:hypothetical protein
MRNQVVRTVHVQRRLSVSRFPRRAAQGALPCRTISAAYGSARISAAARSGATDGRELGSCASRPEGAGGKGADLLLVPTSRASAARMR